LLIQPGSPDGTPEILTLTPQDAEAIQRDCPAVVAAAPVVRGRTSVHSGDKQWVPLYIYGTTPTFLEVRDWQKLAQGKMFTNKNVGEANKVCVLGQTVARELFGDESPVGKEVRVDKVPLKVVGVLSSRGANPMGLDQDDILLAPWTTIRGTLLSSRPSTAPTPSASTTVNSLHQRYPGNVDSVYPTVDPLRQVDFAQQARFTSIDQILVRARSTQDVEAANRQVRDLLRERHRLKAGQPDDFNIRDMTDLTKALSSQR
jgi:ABC-type antimicrobial peptide transport system permease subunit